MKQNTNNKQTILTKNGLPLVSVVMPVYNAELYIDRAIKSILGQSHKNFEFIIVDDCSTDSSLKIIESYARKYRNIKVLKNTRQSGVSVTVKHAIRYAKGIYIARMDADDISLPNRLKKQVKYLENHPQTVAIGAQCFLIDKNDKQIGKKMFPTEYEAIHKYIFSFVPVQQPTLMIARKRLPQRFEYYQDGMNTAEEIELFFKLFQYGKVENLHDFLFKYRIHGKNTSLLNVKKTFILTLISRLRAIAKYNYRPTAGGIIVTIAESIIVLILPQKTSFMLYRIIRKALVFKNEIHGSVNRVKLSTSEIAKA